MSSIGAAPRAAVPSSARAEASRRNGAKSRGPKTPEGKARSAQNAIKHGLCAIRHLVLPGEDAAAFVALEQALFEELAPEGALQTVLARQIVAAAWRLARAERIEAEILIFRLRGERDLGLAVTRDANTAHAVPTLLRYRGAAHAEFMRALKILKALQAEAARPERAAEAAAPFRPKRGRAGADPDRTAHRPAAGGGEPNEPEARCRPETAKPAPPLAFRDDARPEPARDRTNPSRPAGLLPDDTARRTRGSPAAAA